VVRGHTTPMCDIALPQGGKKRGTGRDGDSLPRPVALSADKLTRKRTYNQQPEPKPGQTPDTASDSERPGSPSGFWACLGAGRASEGSGDDRFFLLRNQPNPFGPLDQPSSGSISPAWVARCVIRSPPAPRFWCPHAGDSRLKPGIWPNGACLHNPWARMARTSAPVLTALQVALPPARTQLTAPATEATHHSRCRWLNSEVRSSSPGI
jgi:hypothetical protein